VVPAAYGQLVALEELHLGSNQLTGGVPAELGQLAALSALNLGRNQLTSVLAALGDLRALSQLHLGFNRLTSDCAVGARELQLVVRVVPQWEA
jgi:Leucine-rich repeat (LRR) protein